MKLNADCLRGCLLAIESFDSLLGNLELNYMYIEDFKANKFTEKFESWEIAYTITKLNEASLVNAQVRYADGKIYSLFVTSLSFAGHEYLEKIRNEDKWKKVKSIGGKVGDFSLAAIEKIAEGVTSAAIDKYLKPTTT